VPSPVLSAAPPAPLNGAPPAGAPAAPPPEPTPADVLDALDVGVACVAPDWRVTFVNPAWCEAMGAAAANFVGVSLWAALPSLAAMPEAAVLRATRADGVPRGFRVRYHDARVDGTFDLRVRRATEVRWRAPSCSPWRTSPPASASSRCRTGCSRASATGCSSSPPTGPSRT
jgi:hypothetical protein